MADMDRVIALAQAPIDFWPVELLRSAIVVGCAVALILAGAPLPY